MEKTSLKKTLLDYETNWLGSNPDKKGIDLKGGIEGVFYFILIYHRVMATGCTMHAQTSPNK